MEINQTPKAISDMFGRKVERCEVHLSSKLFRYAGDLQYYPIEYTLIKVFHEKIAPKFWVLSRVDRPNNKNGYIIETELSSKQAWTNFIA